MLHWISLDCRLCFSFGVQSVDSLSRPRIGRALSLDRADMVRAAWLSVILLLPNGKTNDLFAVDRGSGCSGRRAA